MGIIHGIAKLANRFISQIRSLMTPFERSFSELSENHDIGSTEFKFNIFRPRTMGIIHGIAKLANRFISQIRSLMTPFERSFSELSENHKNFDIGSTEFKL